MKHWKEYPPMEVEDYAVGTKLICIHDTFDDEAACRNFLGEFATVEAIHGNHINLKCEGGELMDWEVGVINGTEERRYEIRIVPISWVPDEDIFYLKISGEFPDDV